MHRQAIGTRLQGADIAVIQWHVGVVGNVDEIARPVANMHEAIVRGLTHDRRIFGRESLSAHARITRTLPAFVILAWTIRGDVTPHALPYRITYQRIRASRRCAIRSLRQDRIACHAHQAYIARASIVIIGKINIVVIVRLPPIAITNSDFAIAWRLGYDGRSHGRKIHSAKTCDTRARLTIIVGSWTIGWGKTFHTLPVAVALPARTWFSQCFGKMRRHRVHIAYVVRAVIHVIRRHARRSARSARPARSA